MGNIYNENMNETELFIFENLCYGLYVRNWFNTHDEGMPVCFNEFIDNEYMDSEYMDFIFREYGYYMEDGIFNPMIDDE